MFASISGTEKRSKNEIRKETKTKIKKKNTRKKKRKTKQKNIKSNSDDLKAGEKHTHSHFEYDSRQCVFCADPLGTLTMAQSLRWPNDESLGQV